MKNLFTFVFSIFIGSLTFGQTEVNKIKLSTEIIQTEQETQQQLEAKFNAGNVSYDANYFKVLQFNALPSVAERALWEASGVKLLDYLPDNAYFAMINNTAKVETLLPKLRSILNVDNRFKWEAPLYHSGIPPYAYSESDGIKMVVSYYEGLDGQKILERLTTMGRITEHRDYSRQIDLVIEADQLADLSALPYLQFIGTSDPDPTLEAAFWRGTGRANYLDSGINGLNFTGDGVTIAVGEGGVIGQDNLDYKGRVTEMNSGSSGHKLGVALRAAGAGNLNPLNRGMAYGSDILSVSSSPNYSGLYASHDLRFTNHSLGYGISGFYSQSARNFDLFVESNDAGMVFYSAGNSGGSTGFSPYNGFAGYGNLTGSRKQFKNNVLAASLNASDQNVGFSSKGPTYDGRVAPHMAQEGGGGTSHSAPKMIAAYAILSEVYTTYNPGSEAPSSLLKAAIMNTADDIGVEGIDFRTGYGRVNLRRAHDLLQSDNIIIGDLNNGEADDHIINVPANTHQLRVLVYWRDEAAAVNAATALVNDLDLSVEDPSSMVTLPWVLNHAANVNTLDDPPTRMVDHLNNVEQVTIDAPASGNYTFSVDGFSIPSGPQEYFLVYEFLNEEIQITDPIKDQRLVPGESHYIYWDAYTNSMTDFTLEYRLNGGSWTMITTVPEDIRAYNWTVPNPGAGIYDVEVRISQAGLNSISDKSTIGEIPNDIVVAQHCLDTLYLTWSPVPGATSYNLYMLESKFMTLQGANASVSGNTGKIGGIAGMNEVYFAVSAETSGKVGRRSNMQSSSFGYNIPTSISLDNISVDGCTMGETSYNLQFCSGADIEITATDGFQMSETSGSNFVDTLVLSPQGLGINQDVFVRVDPNYGLGLGTWDGIIKHESGSTVLNVAIEPLLISCVGRSSSNALTGTENGETLDILGLNWNNPTNFTIEWWLNPTSYNSWNQQIGNGWGNFLFHASSDGSVSAGVDNNGSRINSSANLLELNKWQHFAFVKNGNDFTLYYNGESVGTSTSSSNVNWTDFRIGHNGGHSIDGMIDEFRMWETARTATQIRENMHLTSGGDEIGLKVYLQFNAEIGNVIDYSSNCYTTINNGFTRSISSVPVAGGVSVTKNIIDNILHSFDNGTVDTKVDLRFGNPPNGDVVVSHLTDEGPQGQLPQGPLAANNEYWIVHGYGTNPLPTALDMHIERDTINANASTTDFELSLRDHNVETAWSSVGNSSAISGDTIKFIRFLGADQVVLSTPAVVDSIAGSALVLPGGTSDYVTIDPLNLNSNTVTMSAWIKPDGAQNDWAGILFSRDASTLCGLSILNNNELRYHWNGSNWPWGSGAFVNLDQWNHVALVIEPNKSTIYLNGVPYVHNVTNSIEAFDGILRVGSDEDNNTRIFKGEIDEVVIWNKVLTQEEIRAHRHLTKHQLIDSDMEMYLQFNTNDVQYLDKSGNGNGGIANGDVHTSISDAPIGSGSSETLVVNGSGYYASSNGLAFNYDGGTDPDGELRIFKMDGFPNIRPSLRNGPSHYWIVNNYGNNTIFTGLDSLRFEGVDHISGECNSDMLSLYRRAENGHLNSWVKVGNDPSVEVDNRTLAYKSTLTVEEMGQFMLINERGIHWIGLKSTDWDEPYNWTPALVPGIADEAIIRGDAPYQPIVDLDVLIRALIIQQDARLIQLSNTLIELKK